MLSAICDSCKKEIRQSVSACPHCRTALVWTGPGKNIIDTLVPDCLVHRYQGSDLLEPARFLRRGKVNLKVAVAAPGGVKAATVAKEEVFQLDEASFAAINALRGERCDIMRRFDEQIAACWEKLAPYASDVSSGSMP